MGKQLYQTCNVCGRSLPRSREFFKRGFIKELGKEEYHQTCRQCEELEQQKQNWKNGKLKCFSCGKWLDPEEFDKHSQYKYRNNLDKRCKKCKRNQNLEARLGYSNEKRLHKTLQSRVLNAQTRAKSKNIPCTITKEYIFDLWKKNRMGYALFLKFQ